MGKEESQWRRRGNEAKEDEGQLGRAVREGDERTHRQWSHTVALDLPFAGVPLGGDAEEALVLLECLPRLADCSGSGDWSRVIESDYTSSARALQAVG